MMWAACSLAFYGFLRCSEFTVPSQEEYLPTAHLSLQDISVDNRESPTRIQVRIKQSKTDPFRQGCTLWEKQETTSALLVPSYPTWQKWEPDMAHCISRQMGLTSHVACLPHHWQLVCRRQGLIAYGYNTHSFRIGVAMTAKDNGISDVHIKMLSRWKSIMPINCMYIHNKSSW